MRTRFRARNWREWKDLDEDEEFSGSSDDDKEEEEVTEEDRYWVERIAHVLADKKQGRLRWKDDELVVTSGRRLRSSA
jgi:hypothetical protein